jgi:hypothetical protein
LDDQGVAGVAPGADVYFAAAGEDGSPRLDPTRLANAIDMLAEEYECHLITVSAGDSPKPTEEIRFSVQAARERGCLCLFAAGNQGGQPLYPARYPECLAVGACGRRGMAPEGTYLRRVEHEAEAAGEDGLFLWRGSARGEQVELLAAGVGVLWCINGRVASAAWGTSYASPVAPAVRPVNREENEENQRCNPTNQIRRRGGVWHPRCTERGVLLGSRSQRRREAAMVRYIISIKPEHRAVLTPQSLVQTIDGMAGFSVVEGRGRRTLTVEAPSNSLDRLTSALPGVSVRVYEPLALLR